jgi:hypothetical protein
MASFNMQTELAGVDPSLGGGASKPDSGDYKAMISKADVQDNKQKNGTNIAMEFTILDGPFQGAVIKNWMAVKNNSEQAQKIALEALAAIAACTKYGGADPSGMVGKSLTIRILKEPHEFVNTKGERVKTFNTNISMYMTLDHKNAKGDVVPAFIQSITSSVADTGPVKSSYASTSVNHDDEIPF